MRYAICFLVGLAILVLAVGCKDDKLEPKSVRTYAKIVCASPELPDGATWKQFRNRTQDSINTFERVMPPAQVYDYHFSHLALLRAGLMAASAKGKNAPANIYELNDADVVGAAFAHEEAISDLDSDVVRILERAGCNI